MNNIILKDGTTFTCENGVSLLNSASKAGLNFPYSCRTGRCSSCKARLISGESKILTDELGLSTAERVDGWILTCARTAESDLELDIEDLSRFNLAKPQTIPCKINSLKLLASDVIHVTLRLPIANFDFLAGQYIDLIGPNGLCRSYSIANHNFDNKLLELHVKYVHGGLFSKYWFEEAKVNDLLRMHGPLGTFFLRDVTARTLVLMATGTGLAPLKSIAEKLTTLSADAKPSEVFMYWGGRYVDDLYFDICELTGVDKYVPVLSRANADWRGVRGYVQNAVLADIENFSNVVVYACGSANMIRSAELALCEKGLPHGSFYSDAFVSS